MLPRPDLAARRSDDAPLTAVVEDRVSTRTFDDTRPLTADQLGELLYRTARTRRTETVGPGEQLLSRPYPSAGGVYELELYPVVRTVVGVEPGMYHYDSFDHVLRPVAAADSPAVARLIKPAAATLVGGAEPQVLLVIAARPGRILWTYEQIGYALILKDVGALMQTLYLAGTAMGIGVCAQGSATPRRSPPPPASMSDRSAASAASSWGPAAETAGQRPAMTSSSLSAATSR